MGEQRDSNLFHSFARFGIGALETATFTGPGGIDNVISRVTGGVESRIDGMLRSTIPGADVWLLNPSGVVFGEGAKLEVPGSFHASTGDYLGFGEGGLERFYSDGRESVLSTAPPGAFGFLSESGAAAIAVDRAKLDVEPGKTLELVGGNVSLTGAELMAPGGLVSLEAQGAVELAGSRVNVGAGVDGGAPGAVSIRAGRLVLTEGSYVLAENESPLLHEPGGAISIVTSESVLVDNSWLSVHTKSAGDAGAIEIQAGSLEVRNEGNVFAGTAGAGAGGTIEIDVAGRLSVHGADGVSIIEASSFGEGAPGRIDIEAASVELENGGRIETNCGGCTSKVDDRPEGAGTIRIAADQMIVRGEGTGRFADSRVEASSYFGDGDAGTVDLKVTHSLQLLGGGSIQAAGNGITNPGATSNAGNVTIEAGSVFISGAGQIGSGIYVYAANTSGDAGSSGTGEAGTVDVTASESILVTGAGDPRFSLLGIVRAIQFGLVPEITGIFSAGGSGSISLAAPDITLTEGALVLAITVGRADAGDIFLSGDRISVRNGALVDSTSFAPGGNVGNITLEATERIEVVGSRVGVQRGKPFEDVSRVTSASLGSGGDEGGTVTLAAPRILIDGGAVATTALPSAGNEWQGVRGGDITVIAGELIVRGGGRIDASSFIAGPGGSIDVTASDSILVEGKAADGIASGISSRTGAGGDGGAVTLRAPVIEVSEFGEISAKSEADPNLEG